ncbi:hypothetical protein BC834DRAFT_973146 [Gloeopeniophorella convolvens]|nr:hypothetical protein BC834DRAFT_973146 [Gloeopeniophorella convolvens]
MALLDTRRLRSGRLDLVLIIWGEIGVLFYALSGCRSQPVPALTTSAQDTTRILLIAGAQVSAPPLDGQTLPSTVFFLGDMLTAHGHAIGSDEDPGVSNAFSKHVRQRYERHFGRVNQHLSTLMRILNPRSQAATTPPLSISFPPTAPDILSYMMIYGCPSELPSY